MRRNSRYAYATPLDTLNNRLNHRDPRIRDVRHYTTFVLSTNYYAKVTFLQKLSTKYTFTSPSKTFRLATPNEHLATSLRERGCEPARPWARPAQRARVLTKLITFEYSWFVYKICHWGCAHLNENSRLNGFYRLWFSLNGRNEEISVHFFRLLFLFVKIDICRAKISVWRCKFDVSGPFAMWLHQTSRVMTKCMKYNWHRHNITLHIHVFTNYQNIVALQQKMQIKHRHLSINMVFLLGESLQCESLCYALFASYAIANMTLLTSRKYITFSYRRYQVTEPRRLV